MLALPGSLHAERHCPQMPGHPWDGCGVSAMGERQQLGNRAAPAGCGLGALLELLDPCFGHAPLGRVGVQGRHAPLPGGMAVGSQAPHRAGWSPSPVPSLSLQAGAASAPSLSSPMPQRVRSLSGSCLLPASDVFKDLAQNGPQM